MEQTVEALIEELALEESSPLLSFEPTNEQSTIGIPAFLIYLSGLVLISTGSKNNTPAISSFTPTQEERFQKYQKLYYGEEFTSGNSNNNNNDDDRLYRFSPRMLPTANQQKSIGNDIQQKLKELESQSDLAAKDLLETWTETALPSSSSSSSKKSNTKDKKRRKNKKKRNNTAALANPMSEKEQQDETAISSPSKTRSEVLMAIQNETSILLSKQEETDDSSLWVAVEKKNHHHHHRGLSKQKKITTTINNSNKNHDMTNRVVSLSLDMNENIDTTTTTNNDTTFVVPPSSPLVDNNNHKLDETNKITEENKTNDDQHPIGKTSQDEAKNGSTVTNNSTKSLEERILELEYLLEQKENELQEERIAHTKELSKKNLEFDNQIQALQLRLYISETRLKTYQDALSEHMNKVSNNIATSSSSSDTTTTTAIAATSAMTRYSSPKKSRLAVD